MIWTLVIFGITLFILKRYVFGPVGRRDREAPGRHLGEHRGGRAQPRRGHRAARGLQAPASPRPARRPTSCASRAARRASARARARGAGPGPARARRSPTPRSRSRPRPAPRPAACATTSCSLALLAAEKVSRRSLSDADHRRLIEEAIDEADLSAVRRRRGANAPPRERRGHLRRGPLRGGRPTADAVDAVAADVAAFAEAVRGVGRAARRARRTPRSTRAPRRAPSTT